MTWLIKIEVRASIERGLADAEAGRTTSQEDIEKLFGVISRNAIMIENVKVGSLPEDWREQLHAKSDTRITVRIEEAAEQTAANQPEPFVTYTIPRLASGVIA